MDKYQDFYEKIIGFDKYIEVRCWAQSGAVFSEYFDNYTDLQNYILKNKHNLDIYIGVNTRLVKGRKSKDVDYIRNIVFDIEGISEKFSIFNYVNGKREYSDYAKKILQNINYINNYLKTTYNLDISAVVISGRGMHVYITLSSLVPATQENVRKYTRFYKQLIDNIAANAPHSNEIKCDKMCHDVVRVLGAPMTIKVKYPEKPVREIIYLNINTNNNITNILNDIKIVNYSTSIKQNHKRKYIEETIFNSPEFRIFEYHPEPGTQINNRLRLALKLLMARDNIQNFDEVAQRIADLGYPYKPMNFTENEYPDYSYSEKLLNSYVLDNYEWAQKVGFRLPYKIDIENKIAKYKNNIRELPDLFVDDSMKSITTLLELCTEISQFNSRHRASDRGYRCIYSVALEHNILQCITNNNFKQFIIQNDLINRLKYIIQ